MLKNDFQELLNWANARGLFLHPSLERETENGVFGMYAKNPIAANTLLASFPVNNLLINKKRPFKEESENVGLN
jgi:hypothetical protein